jgi:putative ATPase
MSDVINPYIAGNPVTGSEMFFGREDVFEFIRQTLIGQHRDNVIVLYGQRRTGKTSVLYQMHSQLGERYLCIFIDLHGFALEGLDGFLWELANHIVRILGRDHQIDLPRPNRVEFMADPRSFFENEFLNQVWSAIGDRHILLMLDEAIRLQEQVQAGRLGHEIFEYIRHLMQHYPRLNFLFSLGSGLEEMEKEYAFLFNVGLYKKISLLDRDAAIALITQPVKDCYQVEPTTLERILQITSGHPYYTQLLCHCLFNHWQHGHTASIEAREVDELLDEVVERGLAVLKHVWEESTPREKAVIAGMVAAMSNSNCPVGVDDINQAWVRYDIVIPKGEMAKAIRSLIAREVIAGQDKYVFTVDLQRLWVQKYRRLEWVKEEIADAIREWSSDFTLSEPAAQTPLPPPPLRRFSTRLALTVGLVLLLIISSGIIYYTTIFQANQRHLQATATAIIFQANQRHLQATATAIASNYPFSNSPILNDPLSHGNDNNLWDEITQTNDGCKFTAGAYHVYENDKNTFFDCIAKANNLGNLSNFTYEVQMTILKGDCGGIIFRADDLNTKLYLFDVCQDGTYLLSLYVDNIISHIKTLKDSSSSLIKQGLNQSNLLAVVARGQSITLYVNNQPIDQVSDKTYSSGQIGFVAYPYNNPTEVAYNNVRVWSL